LWWVKFRVYNNFCFRAARQASETGNDDVVASLSADRFAQPVVNLPAAVQTEHHVVHFPVAEVDHVVVDEQAVGGEGKAEVFDKTLPAPWHTRRFV
jgi:hypothetical protein